VVEGALERDPEPMNERNGRDLASWGVDMTNVTYSPIHTRLLSMSSGSNLLNHIEALTCLNSTLATIGCSRWGNMLDRVR
jgi:hypothetical protein